MTEENKMTNNHQSHSELAWEKGLKKDHLSQSEWDERFVLSRINSEHISLDDIDIKHLKNNGVSSDRVEGLAISAIKSFYTKIPLKHREYHYTAEELFSRLEDSPVLTINNSNKYVNHGNVFKNSEAMNNIGYRGDKVFCTLKDYDRQKKLDLLPDFFVEDNRMKCSKQNSRFVKDMTPEDIWSSREGLERIVKPIIRDGESLDTHAIRAELETYSSESELIPISMCRWLCSKFRAKRILDINPRWGEFMLSSMTREDSIESYTSVQFIDSVRESFNKSISQLSKDKNKYRIVNCQFEELILSDSQSGVKTRGIVDDVSEDTFDFVYASYPAYGSESTKKLCEINKFNYSLHPDERFSKHDEWIFGHVVSSCVKAWEPLEIGGCLVFNVKDSEGIKTGEAEMITKNGKRVYSDDHLPKKNYSNIEPCVLVLSVLLKNSEYLGYIPFANRIEKINSKKDNPIVNHVWKKRDYPGKQIDDYSKVLEKKYPSLYKRLQVKTEKNKNTDSGKDFIVLETPKTLDTPACISKSHIIEEKQVDNGVELVFDNNFSGVEKLKSSSFDEIISDAAAIKTQAVKTKARCQESLGGFSDEQNILPLPTKSEIEKLSKAELKHEIGNQGMLQLKSSSSKKEMVDYLYDGMIVKDPASLKRYCGSLFSLVSRRVDKGETRKTDTDKLAEILGIQENTESVSVAPEDQYLPKDPGPSENVDTKIEENVSTLVLEDLIGNSDSDEETDYESGGSDIDLLGWLKNN